MCDFCTIVGSHQKVIIKSTSSQWWTTKATYNNPTFTLFEKNSEKKII